MPAIPNNEGLPARWTKLRFHPAQDALIKSKARFKVVPAGRRSGKTEHAKRQLVRAALIGSRHARPAYFAAAPTYGQAKRIYWEDLKALVPKRFIAGKPSESELVIPLINGASIHVFGLEVPERIEGSPWDGGILDEYGNMLERVWKAHVRPALSDRKGWCWLIGVPEGRNHYYHTFQYASRDTTGEWAGFTWKSSDILDPSEIEAAKRDLDPLTYAQEYEADFITFTGRAYYSFQEAMHCRPLKYDPHRPLILCFDFNVSPGVAAICQEQELPGVFELVFINGIWSKVPVVGTGVIGEVYIPQNSNTPAVCRKVIQDWGMHLGNIEVYGDATGGAKGTAKVMGSDWDLIKQAFNQSPFRERVFYFVPNENPRERSRVNAVNSRLLSAAGIVRLMVDPDKASHVRDDLDGVRTLEGGSGELDKKRDPKMTHISDALGYYIAHRFPVVKEEKSVTDF